MARARTSTPAGAGALESAGASAGGGAGSDDVVDEHDLGARQLGLLAVGHGEGPGDVVTALLATKSDLRLRAFGALQCERLVAHPAQSRDLLCQNGRLVEAARRPAVRASGVPG